ncbi:hypothetical protein PM3016_6221 [Paenibacillus mucilaginosus 3016]|uniref:Uncharacterized protein n=1 Tax=Paenibacillus mucilaginosus 3016 TaxID=1116391 RepID=H6NRX4_9BACL|nr:hypothetical protein [Paenibacillus mucilaginosus]AFC32860.1 hypothetical protein PM3016_6221 [Paenibacillus mucilaginosus 3016]WFA21314.1 hypothetical protein ERY13_30775 [Paenibacillus mucilaginosus]
MHLSKAKDIEGTAVGSSTVFNLKGHYADLIQNDVLSFYHDTAERFGYVYAGPCPAEDIHCFIPAGSTATGDLVSGRSYYLIQTVQRDLSSEFCYVAIDEAETILSYSSEVILNAARDVVSNWGINVPVNITDEYNQSANYDVVSNEINVNPLRLYEQMSVNLVVFTIPSLTSLKVVLAHECGHLIDQELKINYEVFSMIAEKCNLMRHLVLNGKPIDLHEYSSFIEIYGIMLMKFENNAWNLGQKFIDDKIRTLYDADNRVNLVMHERKIQMMKQMCDALMP